MLQGSGSESSKAMYATRQGPLKVEVPGVVQIRSTRGSSPCISRSHLLLTSTTIGASLIIMMMGLDVSMVGSLFYGLHGLERNLVAVPGGNLAQEPHSTSP
jgi:hypothetical protein